MKVTGYAVEAKSSVEWLNVEIQPTTPAVDEYPKPRQTWIMKLIANLGKLQSGRYVTYVMVHAGSYETFYPVNLNIELPLVANPRCVFFGDIKCGERKTVSLYISSTKPETDID